MNNREWLTSLSDEEFTGILFNGCCNTCAYGMNAATFVKDCMGDCVNGILAWLEMEHDNSDSWERIGKDAHLSAGQYWGCDGFVCAKCPSKTNGLKPYERYEPDNCVDAKWFDLAHRCMELSGKAVEE